MRSKFDQNWSASLKWRECPGYTLYTNTYVLYSLPHVSSFCTGRRQNIFYVYIYERKYTYIRDGTYTKIHSTQSRVHSALEARKTLNSQVSDTRSTLAAPSTAPELLFAKKIRRSRIFELTKSITVLAPVLGLRIDSIGLHDSLEQRVLGVNVQPDNLCTYGMCQDGALGKHFRYPDESQRVIVSLEKTVNKQQKHQAFSEQSLAWHVQKVRYPPPESHRISAAAHP